MNDHRLIIPAHVTEAIIRILRGMQVIRGRGGIMINNALTLRIEGQAEHPDAVITVPRTLTGKQIRKLKKEWDRLHTVGRTRSYSPQG